MMKLWRLAALEDRPNGPWAASDYDTTTGHVVRAETEVEARQYAAGMAGNEGAKAWLDSNFATCSELLYDGQPGVVISDFNAG